jgi:predicted cupin superfamily sugar epimerase
MAQGVRRLALERLLSRPTAAEVIELLGLEPMGAEQLSFRRYYASARTVDDGRPLATAIVCLLEAGPEAFSDFHRLPTDELWHFHLGDPIQLVLLNPDGSDRTIILGTDLRSGEVPFAVVPAGSWMGARLARGEWAVFGCTMSPGFAPSDFEGAEPADLIAGWPQCRAEILAMTRSNVPRTYGN